MAWFTFKAIDPSGAVFTGEMEASSADQVIDRLLDQGYTPIDTDETSTRQLSLFARLQSDRLSPSALALFTEQLATLLDAGLTLELAFETLLETLPQGPMRRLTRALLDDIRKGLDLSDAMARYPKSFPSDYCGLVAAGESSGVLDKVLERLAVNLERSQSIREKVISALIYPSLLLAMIFVALLVILLFVLPQFEPLFDQAGADLPPATKLVLDIGHFVQSNWIGLLIGLLGLIFGVILLSRNYGVRFVIDRLLFLPNVFFGLVQKVETANFARTLSLLLGNGLTLARAIDIAKQATNNLALASSLGHLSTQIREGQAFSRWLKDKSLFPVLLTQLVRVGEETGKLQLMLEKSAALFERDVEKTIDRALALLVPVLTLVMGGIVAFFVGAVMMGLTSINQIAF